MLEKLLRASVYSRGAYLSMWAVFDWEQIYNMSSRLEAHRRRRLHLSNSAVLNILTIPISKGGLGCSHFCLEFFIIPVIREMYELLNSTDARVVLEFIGQPNAQRLERSDTQLRVEDAIRRVVPYGLTFVDNRFHLIGRALALMQKISSATRNRSQGYRRVLELYEAPSPHSKECEKMQQ
jgi:hypothetical protein